MDANQEMLDAHVAFELERLSGQGLAESIAQEVPALFDWLDSVTLNDLGTPKMATKIFLSYTSTADLTPEAAQLVGHIARSVHEAAAKNESRLGDVISEDSFTQGAQRVARMAELRAAVTTQITTNEVYASLISHVLYQGIKNYLQAENVIARKVPGASTLMRMGQNAISTAAPKLEQAVDRQLTAFVNSNIQDSIRDSKTYLDKVLDDELILAVANEVWESNASSTIAELAELVPADAVDDFVAAGNVAWVHLRTTELFGDVTQKAIAALFAEYGDQPVGELLGHVGFGPAVGTSLGTDVLTPIFDKAAADGYLEERIRLRLAAFYDSYSA
ncbi:MAG: hypothetical protein ACJAY5_000981 [Actinomycetes bacterium]|jgi:hypothetical protein